VTIHEVLMQQNPGDLLYPEQFSLLSAKVRRSCWSTPVGVISPSS
jgi:hypothetical protein